MSDATHPRDPWDPESETGDAYVEVPAEPSPMTFEGVIAGYGKLAQTAKRGTGWRRSVGFALVVVLALPILVAVAAGLISLLSHL